MEWRWLPWWKEECSASVDDLLVYVFGPDNIMLRCVFVAACGSPIPYPEWLAAMC